MKLHIKTAGYISIDIYEQISIILQVIGPSLRKSLSKLGSIGHLTRLRDVHDERKVVFMCIVFL